MGKYSRQEAASSRQKKLETKNQALGRETEDKKGGEGEKISRDEAERRFQQLIEEFRNTG